MKFLSVIFAFIAINFSIADAKADNCQYTFRCQGSICERALPASCTTNASNAVIYTSPPVAPAIGLATSDTAPSVPIFFQNEATAKKESLPTPSSSLGCAENGSCYGDISNINGMPKTQSINGYFRKDGTYVRGHYRSSGRR
jgi:hypothetical protein